MTAELKICFFNSTKRWGGGEKWHAEMAQELSNSGIKVLVAAGKDSDLLKRVQGVLPFFEVRVRNLSFLNPFKLLQLRRHFLKEGVTAIILNLPSDLKTAGIAARMAGVEKIIYRRGSAIPVKDSRLNRILFRHVITDIIANSEATKNTILQQNEKLFDPRRIHVIYNGINTNVSVEQQRPTDGIVVLGVAARMVEQKGYDYLAEIALKLKNTKRQFKFRIAGTGPLEAKVKQWFHEKGLQSCVEFVGFVDDMNAFMQSIDVFLLPSKWEGFGYVLAEAMLNKRPIIAFNISSNPELVYHNKNGYLCEPFHTNEFAEYVCELIDNPEIRREFGEFGFNLVCSKFSIEQSVQNLRHLFSC